MEEEIKIGNWEERLERGLEKLEQDPLVSERNRELILRYLRDARLGKTLYGRAKKKIGPARLLTNTIHLTNDALTNGGSLSIRYVNAEGQSSSRVIRPETSFASGRCTYIRAFCEKSSEVRTFRLDRIIVLDGVTNKAQ